MQSEGIYPVLWFLIMIFKKSSTFCFLSMLLTRGKESDLLIFAIFVIKTCLYVIFIVNSPFTAFFSVRITDKCEAMLNVMCTELLPICLYCLQQLTNLDFDRRKTH